MADFVTAPEASAGIDVMLGASVFETVRDRIPAAEPLRMAGAIVRHPGPVGEEITALARRLASIIKGSAMPAIPANRRFADRAWQGQPTDASAVDWLRRDAGLLGRRAAAASGAGLG